MPEQLKFVCPKCSSNQLEEILYGARVAQNIDAIYSDGDAEYGPTIVDDGDIYEYRCTDCGFKVTNVGDTRQLAEWLSYQKYND